MYSPNTAAFSEGVQAGGGNKRDRALANNFNANADQTRAITAQKFQPSADPQFTVDFGATNGAPVPPAMPQGNGVDPMQQQLLQSLLQQYGPPQAGSPGMPGNPLAQGKPGTPGYQPGAYGPPNPNVLATQLYGNLSQAQ